jgi:hypothetical protein
MRLRKPTVSGILAAIALFLALGGSAVAANHYLITKTSQIKPSVLSQLKGRDGANGANGASVVPGPQGPAGPQGAAGPPERRDPQVPAI